MQSARTLFFNHYHYATNHRDLSPDLNHNGKIVTRE